MSNTYYLVAKDINVRQNSGRKDSQYYLGVSRAIAQDILVRDRPGEIVIHKTIIVSDNPLGTLSTLRKSWNYMLRRLEMCEGTVLGRAQQEIIDKVERLKGVRFAARNYQMSSDVDVFCVTPEQADKAEVSTLETDKVIFIS